jgi:nitrate/TMAO reductase-like tetraheme cytochrome c subunit
MSKPFSPGKPATDSPGEMNAKRRRRLSLTIDLSQPRHRRGLLIAVALFILTFGALSVAGVKTYQYTESSEFCGTLCHTMDPQYARYERSAHENVECAQCHIGPGTSFFVKSKIDGIRQVYAMATNTYSRPIKSPVHNLRPSRETCETCHTPSSFKDNVIKKIVHYDNDSASTRIQSTLVLKMGGQQEATGLSQGIHWHTSSEVYYIAADEQRQVILWVGVKQPDGSLKEFFARDLLNVAKASFVEKARAEGKVRLMDCIDCHNRTAHYTPSPTEAVDQAISAGLIPTSIPSIRKDAVAVLSAAHSSQAEAYAAIDGLPNQRAEVADTGHAVDVAASGAGSEDRARAVGEIKRIYDAIDFPEMNANWATNPNNEKHTPFPGCFRCHDDKHVAVDTAGNEVQTISVKCNLCHTVPIVGRGTETLVEAPVIIGAIPTSHADFRWTTEHRDVTDAEKKACMDCHGQAFCNNGACHNLSHPKDMLFSHAEEYRKQGNQVCYTCHQDVLCSRCHPGGTITNP